MPVKGKDERGVGYVKSNGIAGRRFASWAELEAHLAAWTREVADVRVHGTTGETPIERFARDEALALRPLAGTPPFISARDLLRRVGADCAIEVDGNAYSVPWRLIGERVRVTVGGDSVRVLHAGREVALHAELKGRHGRVTDDGHLAGIAGAQGGPVRLASTSDLGMEPSSPCVDGLCGARGRGEASRPVQSCVRPVSAVLMTAGLDEVRGSDPNQFCALEVL